MNGWYLNDISTSMIPRRIFVRIRSISDTFPPLEEGYHNSKNTTFQERVKSTGQGDAVESKEQRRFSPSWPF
jgi:hypothetical protein